MIIATCVERSISQMTIFPRESLQTKLNTSGLLCDFGAKNGPWGWQSH